MGNWSLEQVFDEHMMFVDIFERNYDAWEETIFRKNLERKTLERIQSY